MTTQTISGKTKQWNVVFSEAHKHGLKADEAQNMSIADMLQWTAENKVYNPPVEEVTLFEAHVNDVLKELEGINTLEELNKFEAKHVSLSKNPKFKESLINFRHLLKNDKQELFNK